MSNISFLVANQVEHYDILLNLNIEYVSWVFDHIERLAGIKAEEVTGVSVPEYVASVLPKICGESPPVGVFYLIQVDDDIAGMCGLRFLRSGVAEIKRLYVRPAYRGMKLGELALRTLLSDATHFGYTSVCLDTGPFMSAAQRLYEAMGFVDCPAYEGVEVPVQFHPLWRFMQRPLPS